MPSELLAYTHHSSTRRSFIHNPTTTTDIYTLSLHDALPISDDVPGPRLAAVVGLVERATGQPVALQRRRSEEHTSELQSRENLVCRLLLEKKKTKSTR